MGSFIGSIAIGIAVALLIACITNSDNGGGLIRRVRHRRTGRYKRVEFEGFKHVSAAEWITVIIIGFVVGAINYFTTRLTYETVFVAPVMMIVMIVIVIYIVYWWTKGMSLWTIILFILLVLLLWPVLEATAWAATAITNSMFITTIILVIPKLLVTFAIGWMIFYFFRFRYMELDRVDDYEANYRAVEAAEAAESRDRLLAVLTIIVMVMIMGYLVYTGIDWSSLGMATYSEVTVPEEEIVIQQEEPPTVTPTQSQPEKVGLENVTMTAEEAEAVKYLTIEKVTPALLERLTIDKYSHISQVMLKSSLSPHDKTRVEAAGFSDALTYGFQGKTDNEKFLELQEEILRNPVYAVTVVNALKDKTIGGKPISSFNSWMTEMSDKNRNGVSYWLEYRDGDTLYVTDEFRQYAATLCTWLERLINHGVQTRQTTENWCLNNSALNDERAGIKASYQYAKEALVLYYVGKNQSGDANAEGLLAVGFNIHDKRPEFYGGTPENPTVYRPPLNPAPTPLNPTPAKPNPTPAPGPNPQPNPTPNPQPNPTPTPAPNPTPTPVPPQPTPTPQPDPYNKDKTQGTQGDVVAPNDDPGPGPSTNNGVGATESTQDQPTNSNHLDSYEEYKEEVKELAKVNTEQKTSQDNNTPTVPKEEVAKQLTGNESAPVNVDNNGDTGNGGAPIDEPTPVTAPAVAADTGEAINDSPGGEWEGPPD
ncbi:hypothetical protein IKD98_01985 [Candidatus Saccharibacteria bacterium]|nr:hypothetical protein [Candidatus Saccharibacteria bacterium]